MSRLPLKLEAQQQRGQVSNVQRVQFRRPRIRPRSIATSAIGIYVCYSIYSRVVLDPLERAAVEALKNIPEEELEDEMHKPIFIPFPGTTKQLNPKPYRGSDPEWQEFIKFSKDQKLAQKVREELANYVQQVALRHPVLAIRCGKQMTLRRYWLDVDFPQLAPPEFERSGIEIGDDYITWGTQPVDSLTVFRLRQALWPSALIQSFWSFTKVMVADDAKRIAGMLGMRSSPPPASLDQILARHQQLMKRPQTPSKDGPPAALPQPAGDATKAITAAASPEKSTLTGRKQDEVEVGPTTNAAMVFHAHFFRAIMAFKSKMAQTWRPAPSYPPRGSILVSGLVELDSPKAWLVFDVKAAWDPKTRSYDGRSMHLQLRRMQLKKQGPTGGA